MVPYTWIAVYQDGTTLHQIDPITGEEISSNKIDRRRVRTVIFHGPVGPAAVVHVDPASVFFYRRRVALASGGGDGNGVVHILGCWRKLDAESYPAIQHAIMVPEVSYGVPVIEVCGQPVSGGNLYAVVPIDVEMEAFTAIPSLLSPVAG